MIKFSMYCSHKKWEQKNGHMNQGKTTVSFIFYIYDHINACISVWMCHGNLK